MRAYTHFMGTARTWILPGIAIACAFGLGVAACSVDPFLMCGDACDDGGTVDASFGADASSDAADGSTCEPKTCANYPSDCHPSLDNGCGSTLDCSSACPQGQDCVADAGAAKPGFFCSGPPVCIDAGAPGGNCNALTNPGTGQTTDCGNCTGGFACTANTCGCVGLVCGAAACCTGGQVCDTSNTTCCTQESTATACGTKCNTTVQDNCHKSVSCGACANNYSCAPTNTCFCSSGKVCGAACCSHASDVCYPSTTCCVPDSNSTTCNGKCGTVVPNNCNENINCKSNCSSGDVCGGGTCSCGSSMIVLCLAGQTCSINGAGNGSCL